MNFLDSHNFRCQKHVKKVYMEMTKKIYLETLKSALGRSFLHYLLDVRHFPKLQSCAISRKTNDPTLRKWQKL